eukprot:354574-Chlamydomonas_euryale.AAC.14
MHAGRHAQAQRMHVHVPRQLHAHVHVRGNPHVLAHVHATMHACRHLLRLRFSTCPMPRSWFMIACLLSFIQHLHMSHQCILLLLQNCVHASANVTSRTIFRSRSLSRNSSVGHSAASRAFAQCCRRTSVILKRFRARRRLSR